MVTAPGRFQVLHHRSCRRALGKGPAQLPPGVCGRAANRNRIVLATSADWGGEKNDLFTTRLVIDGKRLSTAMAFKGRGTTGKLTPGKLGKNGDQIQRLFQSSANVFLVQYYGQIDESVLDQMTELAKAKSGSTGQKILFGVIDKADTTRIMNAYPKVFG